MQRAIFGEYLAAVKLWLRKTIPLHCESTTMERIRFSERKRKYLGILLSIECLLVTAHQSTFNVQFVKLYVCLKYILVLGLYSFWSWSLYVNSLWKSSNVFQKVRSGIVSFIQIKLYISEKKHFFQILLEQQTAHHSCRFCKELHTVPD